MEQTGLIQTFVESSLEHAVAPTCSLNFLHQNSKLLSTLVAIAYSIVILIGPSSGLGATDKRCKVIERLKIDARKPIVHDPPPLDYERHPPRSRAAKRIILGQICHNSFRMVQIGVGTPGAIPTSYYVILNACSDNRAAPRST